MNQSAAVTVTSTEAARMLTEPSEFRFLKPFIGQELSLSRAAAQVSAKLTTMHYRVRKLMALGLLEVTREERRSGRAVKLYRATADEYLVPFEVTPYASLEAVLFEMMGPSDRAFISGFVAALLNEATRYSVHVAKQQPGEVLVRLAPSSPEDWQRLANTAMGPNSPAIWISNAQLRLDHSQAKRLQRELIELLQRYGDNQPGGGQVYLLRLGLAPKVGEDP